VNFKYYNPVKIDFGIDALNRLPQWVGNRKALLITSNGFEERGVVATVKEKTSMINRVINNIQPNPTLGQLEVLYKELEFESFDVIVALGGGSVIDIAKALSIYKEKPSDEPFKLIENMLFNGYQSDEILYKPIIAIPTTAGTGSEVTPWGTIWDDINKMKYSIHTDFLWCEAAIYDPNITLSLTKELTIQTGLDALSHSLESLWNHNRNPVSQMYAVEAIRMIVTDLPLLAKDLSNPLLREKMMLATTKAGLAFSNTQTAVAHAISYYLTLHHGVAHGIAASITLPTITEVGLSDTELKEILVLALGSDPVATLENMFRELNVSNDLVEYGLKREELNALKESLLSTSRIKNSLIDVEMLFDKFESEYK